MTDRLLYSLAEAAEQVNMSTTTLRKAIQATDPAAFPPPLKAKRDSRDRYLIPREALAEWIASLPDA